jgi:hypothetical protein
MTACIGCGCTDEEACEGGCFWVARSPSEFAGACSTCLESGLIPMRGVELAQELIDVESDWLADQISIGQDYSDIDRDPKLILPGDPEFAGVLRGYR